VRVDFAPAHREPSAVRFIAATVVSLAGSLAADAVLVVIGTAVFPTTRHYVHFRFSDYAALTIIGVLIASWPGASSPASAHRRAGFSSASPSWSR
jgi:hypothetical protein